MPTLRALLGAAVTAAFLVLAPIASAADHVPGQVVVRFASDAGAGDRAAALDAVDGSTADTVPGLPQTRVVDIPKDDSVSAAVNRLEARDDVVWAEPNWIYKPTKTPNDPRFGQQWAQLNIGQFFSPDTDGAPSITGIPGDDMGAATAWDATTGSPNVLVGVADTGVASAHEDLAPNVRLPLARDFRDAGGGVGNPNADASGHGTHVAGTIGAAGNNGLGVAGVSWNPGIVPLRVLNPEGGTDAQIAAGFAYAGEAGLPIVNASLGGPGASQAQQDAIRQSPNTLFVIAAGNSTVDNDGPNAAYPCSFPDANIICVAALNPRDGLASFSNFGRTTVDLGAPGTNILSTYPTFATIDDAGFTAPDWAVNPGWVVNAPNSLDAAWVANRDTTAELNQNLDLSGRTGCSASVEGTVDIQENEGVLTLERSIDNGLTWRDVLTQTANADGGGVSPAQVDLDADGQPSVLLRFRFTTTPAITPGPAGVSITRLHVQCTTGASNYEFLQGTSMASPEVAGAAALLKARNPGLTMAQLRDAILSTVTPIPALAGRTVTGGRLNLAAAMAKVAPASPSSSSSTTSTTTTATTTTPTLPVVPPVTATPAGLRLSKSARQQIGRRGYVVVKVTTDRNTTVTASGSLAVSGRARAAATVRLKSARARATANRPVTLKLSVPASKRRLVRRSRSVSAKLLVRDGTNSARETIRGAAI
jgi:thermitase